MDYMMDLKDLLCADLEDHTEKGKKSGKMSMGDLETIHKLTDTVKNILKINVLEEELGGGYSEDGRYMGEGRIYGMSYDDGMSYDGGSSYARRGGRGRGRNARRDRMGRYSSDDGMSYKGGSYARDGSPYGMSYDGAKEHLMDKAEEMLEMTQDPKERRAIEKFMRELED